MSADDSPNACGGGVQVEIVDGVDEVEKASAQLDGFGGVQIIEDRGGIHIAADGGEGSDLAQAIEDTRIVDVPGMEDVVDARQFGDGFGAEQTVCVGDDADMHKAECRG